MDEILKDYFLEREVIKQKQRRNPFSIRIRRKSFGGDSDKPYIPEGYTPIYTWEDLDNVRNDVSGNYFLMNNLDSSSVGYDDYASSTANGGEGWLPPIGFSGTFDGNNKTISDLYINRPNTDYQGLFGRTNSNAIIKNIGLENVNIRGKNYVGGLIGNNIGGTISNSYSTGSVTGDYVGGLVGRNYGGTISNSYSTGSVTGTRYVGGLVGRNYEKIYNSYSTGSVEGVQYVGGLIGNNIGGTITNSYYDKETSGQSDTGKGEGKTTEEMKQQATFVDWDFDNVWKIEENVDYPRLMRERHNYFYVDYNNNSGDTEADPIRQGVTEINSGVGNLPTPPTKGGYTFKNWNTKADGSGTEFKANTVLTESLTVYAQWELITFRVDFDNNGGDTEADPQFIKGISYFNNGISNFPIPPERDQYIFKGWNTLADGSGIDYTEETKITSNLTLYAKWGSAPIPPGYIPIYTWEDLANVTNGKNYFLMNDLDETTDGYDTYASSNANSGKGWNPIAYSGEKIFDGNFHIIKGLYINRPNSDNVGLFNRLIDYGIVKNLGIADCDITGQYNVGGLAGTAEVFGGIHNCFVTGKITGNEGIGGLLGESESNHKGESGEWEGIDGIYNCYTACEINGNTGGGLIGEQYVSDFTNCYSASYGNNLSGGLIGYNGGNLTINNCYYDKDISGRSESHKGTPKTTEEMKQEATFVNWDFVNTWEIDEENDYPKLKKNYYDP